MSQTSLPSCLYGLPEMFFAVFVTNHPKHYFKKITCTSFKIPNLWPLIYQKVLIRIFVVSYLLDIHLLAGNSCTIFSLISLYRLQNSYRCSYVAVCMVLKQISHKVPYNLKFILLIYAWLYFYIIPCSVSEDGDTTLQFVHGWADSALVFDLFYFYV